jgi:hypothetical protein
MKKYVIALLILLVVFSPLSAQRLRREGSTFQFYTMDEVTNLILEQGMHIYWEDDIQYPVGSALSNSINSENWNKDQMTFRIWFAGNFVPGDGLNHYFLDNTGSSATQNRIELYIDTSGLLIFDLHDTDSTQHRVQYDVTGWGAKEWHQIAARFDFENNEIELYTDGVSRDSTPDNALSSDTVTAVELNSHAGSDTSGLAQINGVMTLQAFSRSWSDAEVTADYDSGAGSSFRVGVDTLLMAKFSNDDTGLAYWHSSKAASAIVDGGTEDTITTDAGSDISFAEDNLNVLVSDATGYGIQCFVDGTPSSTSIDVDDGAGADAGTVEEIGVSIDCDATYYATAANNTVHDITTEDIGISAWVYVNSDAPATQLAILSKLTVGSQGYSFYVVSGKLNFYMQDADPDSYLLTSNIDLRDSTWHHVAVVVDRNVAGSCQIYVDGVDDTNTRVGTLADVGSITSTATMGVGHTNTGRNFDGKIRDVVIAYLADITAANEMGSSGEILALTTNPHNPSAWPNSEDYWLIDANTGTTLTGQNNNLTLSNAAAWSQEAYISRNRIVDNGMENGGIGGWTVGDAATTISKSTTERYKGIQSLHVLNGDGSQAYARQTLNTTNADSWFFGRFFAPSTPNGASQLVDIDANADLGITVTQAGLSAGWNTVECAFRADDASTTVDFGSGSTTNAEFGYWDDVRFMRNLAPNPGFEGVYDDESGGGGGTIDVAIGWNNNGCETDGSDELSKEAGTVRSGSGAQKFDVDATSEGIIISRTAVVGEYYTVSGYLYVTSGVAALWVQQVPGDNYITLTTTTGSWEKLSFTFAAEETSPQLVVTSSGGAAVFYVDDVMMMRADQVAASTVTKTPGFYPKRNPLSP